MKSWSCSAFLVWIGSCALATVPLPDAADWRALPRPEAVFAGTDIQAGRDGGFLVRVQNNSRILYSWDGILWEEVPRTLFQHTDPILPPSFNLYEGGGRKWMAIGKNLFQIETTRNWILVAENLDWIHVDTAWNGGAPVRVGEISLPSGGRQIVAASLQENGSWIESRLEEVSDTFLGRLMLNESGMVYAGESAYWSSSDGVEWQEHPVPDLLAGVPPSVISGHGPFLVSWSGNTGTPTGGPGSLKTVFARSENGFEWSIPGGNMIFPPPAIVERLPWWQRTYQEVSNGTLQSKLQLSLDGIDWQDWPSPIKTPAMLAMSRLDDHWLGVYHGTMYALDLTPSLASPEVTATDGIGGINLSWKTVPGAARYVVVTEVDTFQTENQQMFIPYTFLSDFPVSVTVSGHLLAISSSGQPGTPSQGFSATAINGDLPPPQAPLDPMVFAPAFSLSQFKIQWSSVGGTRLHEVGWSYDSTDAAVNVIDTVETPFMDLPLETLPSCQQIYLWVRGSNGREHSNWVGPVRFTAPENGLPCPPSPLDVVLVGSGEVWRLQWNPVGGVSDYQVRRLRLGSSGEILNSRTLSLTSSSSLQDVSTFFDTRYRYEVRSRYLRSFLEPLWSPWSSLGEVRRAPSAEEEFAMEVLGWNSLGEGRFYSDDLGLFSFPLEDFDWARLEDQSWIWFGTFDPSFTYAVFTPDLGWLMVPLRKWPYAWSAEKKSWIWIASGVQGFYDFSSESWTFLDD